MTGYEFVTGMTGLLLILSSFFISKYYKLIGNVVINGFTLTSNITNFEYSQILFFASD